MSCKKTQLNIVIKPLGTVDGKVDISNLCSSSGQDVVVFLQLLMMQLTTTVHHSKFKYTNATDLCAELEVTFSR